MKTLKAFLCIEFKRFFTRRNIVLMITFLAFALYFTHSGVREYKSFYKGIEEFKKVESEKVKQFMNWDQYGGYGLDILFIPSKMSVFFHKSSPFIELTAHFDVSERLNFQKSFKGRRVFRENTGGYMDLAGFILLFGSLMSLLYGFDGFRKSSYLKFLASITGYRQCICYIRLARAALLTLFYSIVIVAAVLWVRFIGSVKLSGGDFKYILFFYVIALLVQFFFFLFGTIAASVRISWALYIIVAFWILFAYVVPTITNELVESKAGAIPSNYKSELEKNKYLLEFEKEMKEKSDEEWLAQFASCHQLINELKKKGLKTSKELNEWLLEYRERNEAANVIDHNTIKADPDTIVRFNVWLNMQKDGPVKLGDWLVFEIRKAASDKFLVEVFPKIKETEEKMQEKVIQTRDRLHLLSMLFPSNFYLITNGELSSKGYSSAVKFFQYSLNVKEKFMTFYLTEKNKEKPGKEKKGKVNSFIKEMKNKEGKDYNLFYAQSTLPEFWWIGLLIAMLLIMLLFYGSNYLLKRLIHPSPKEKEQKELDKVSDLEVEIKNGRFNVLFTIGTASKAIWSQLFNVLSGNPQKKVAMPGKVFRDNQEITEGKEAHKFIYFCKPDELPGEIAVKDFILFISRLLKLSKDQLKEFRENARKTLKKDNGDHIGDLELEEQARLILETAKHADVDIMFFFQFTKGTSLRFFKEFRETMQKIKEERNVGIFYLTSDMFTGKNLGDMVYVHKKDSALLKGVF